MNLRLAVWWFQVVFSLLKVRMATVLVALSSSTLLLGLALMLTGGLLLLSLR